MSANNLSDEGLVSRIYKMKQLPSMHEILGLMEREREKERKRKERRKKGKRKGRKNMQGTCITQ